MHVVMVSTGWYPVLPCRVGAIEPTIYSVCEKLSILDYVDYLGIGSGHKKLGNLNIFTLYSEVIPQNLIKILGHRLGFHLPFNLFLIKKILQIHNKHPIEVIHINDAHSGFATSFIKLLLGIPFVFTIHNEIQFSLSIRKCDRILTVSEYIKNFLIKTRKINKRKVEVSYLGVDLDAHEIKNTFEAKKTLGLQTFIVLLFVGRKCPEKGPQVIIEALPSIVRSNPSVLAIFVGPDYFFKETSVGYTNFLINKAKKLGVYQNVCFKTFVTDDELKNYYNAADVIIAPSTWPDPCPQVVKEALAHQKPVVSSKIGGIPDIITNGYNGLLVPPKDAIALANAVNLLLSDSKYADKLAKNGRRVIEEKFSVKITAENYRKVYKDILSKKR